MEIKSWLSKFLPKDEYKEKRILYFIAESAVILAIFLFVYGLINNFSLYGGSTAGTISLLSLGLLVTYVLIRYILSGIEYPEVINEKQYKKEKKVIINRSIMFIILYTLFFSLVDGFPTESAEFFQLFGSAICVSLVTFLIGYISLKKSYNKNKDLID